MLFDSSLYIWFLLIVFAGYWLLAPLATARTLWLLVASYGFYASWNAKFLGLIILSTAIDYGLGLALGRASDPKRRLALVWTSVGVNLGLLGLFKYTDFFLSTIQDLADAASLGVQVPLLKLMLPVGISFYTFQTMSYTIDIYRREIEPIRDPLKFALFVSFFPQLVAGPIVRAREFLPQLLRSPRLDVRQQQLGVYLIALGLIKKVAIANYLSINLVDRVFENPSAYSALEVLCGVYGYAMQIYCDFSGYSDVAIGSALLLGFKLPKNFDRPYAAADLQEFWRRWHLSLSTWLRDYLYISLGGNRRGLGRTYRNLILTMVLGGLWHGASWNFVIWGALHGGALALNRAWQARAQARPRERGREREHERGRSWGSQGMRRAVGIVATFHFVCFAWIFFRAQDFGAALDVLRAMTELTVDSPNLSPTLALVLFGSLALHLSPTRLEQTARAALLKTPIFIQALLLVCVAIALNKVKGSDVVPFIYFQF